MTPSLFTRTSDSNQGIGLPASAVTDGEPDAQEDRRPDGDRDAGRHRRPAEGAVNGRCPDGHRCHERNLPERKAVQHEHAGRFA